MLCRRARLMDVLVVFFFNDTATTEIYTLSLHDALPIFAVEQQGQAHREGHLVRVVNDDQRPEVLVPLEHDVDQRDRGDRSEEHTSELQSRQYLVCRLLLEKTKKVVTAMTAATSQGANAA